MAYQSINPYTNELLKTYPDATDADLEAALSDAHQLYKTWRNDDPASRAPYLKKVAVLLREQKTELATIMTKEMGKLLTEAEGEVDLCANIVDYYADHGADLLKPVPLKTDAGKAYYAKQATGVIFAVEPWNFPLYQIVRVFAPNFMVGNPMILKHASNIPGSADAFDKLVQKAGAPKGSFKNLFVNYDQVSKAIADPRVTGVALTGSERGGSSVAKAAGENLKKSSMELGGNDAFIILDDADFDLVHKVAPQARLYNAGQVCTSSKRFIVMADHYDDFLEHLKAGFAAVKPGDPLAKETTLAPLCTKNAKEKLTKQVQAAIDGGAKVYYGNEPIDLPGQFFPPTILTNITKDNPIYNQELFGPVAAVYKVNSEEEAIALANDSSYGLGGSVFSADPEHANRVAEQIETGMSFINSGWLSLPELPFGGVKNSGYGRELSDLGLNAFVNEHLVINTTDK
ncbi:NAD-dependent succinate-semialdehyde dehydrogenase [Loigolactobacillus rennini]|uniref:Succinate-semialdehyde dehydrogenase (NADP+) n=1 Tax=Loigolactobacillus rennini DSM 20253 TaxID=1423796 RepID=A0A0R2CYR2_9LACO|nr:NAD-dependent succinate-semialdehyde dehydrogenase [Loigolactobacillus rennini]KRM94804.1 succinate-semialdehyde dehydrogenase (NADP+) [Loigolactobacillus rennini DSM 20253]